MRFATSTGAMIDVYQVVTQMTDESGQTYPFTIDSLLDKALGSEGYYGAFTANIHTDSVESKRIGCDCHVGQSSWRPRHLRQTDAGLAGRTEQFQPEFAVLERECPELYRYGGARRERIRGIGTPVRRGQINNITHNGSSVGFTLQTIKGIRYAVFPAMLGEYQVFF